MRKTRSSRVDPSAPSSTFSANASASASADASTVLSSAATAVVASASLATSSSHGRRQLSLLTSQSKDTAKRQLRIPPPSHAPSSASSASSSSKVSSTLVNKTPSIAIRRHLHPAHFDSSFNSAGSRHPPPVPKSPGAKSLSRSFSSSSSVSGGGNSTLSTSLNPEPLTLGEIYLNDLSDLRVFDLINLEKHAVCVHLSAEFRKPFHHTTYGFQLENENYNSAFDHLQSMGDNQEMAEEDFSQHMPQSVLRATSKAALWAENLYLSEAYNELFNQIGLIDQVVLEPEETKRIFFSMCVKMDNHDGRTGGSSASGGGASGGGAGSMVGGGTSGTHGTGYNLANADSSEEERMHLNETSCLVLSGKLVLKVQFMKHPKSSVPLALSLPNVHAETSFPLQGQVCRSILRVDVKELHFDDCVPGGSYVKDFTVWNRSEIPLLFKLISSFDSTKESITCTDYNTGFVIDDRTCQAAAYGHIRIRVTYRPVQVGEQSFEVHVQNLHDSRNVKILKIHAIASKEHHREGLAIKEPNGSYLMSGSKLDFGDCYTGVATSKLLILKNTTEASLHVELTSDRPKEINFELKLLQNRSRSARAPRSEDLLLSPSDSNDGSRSSRKGSLSPEMRRLPLGNTSELESYGVDSDEEADDNEGDFFDDDFALPKRVPPEDIAAGELDDLDDDFEFDGERPVRNASPTLGPKTRNSHTSGESLKRTHRTKTRTASKKIPRVRDLQYGSGVESGTSACSSPERRITRRSHRPTGFSLTHEDPAGSNFLVETLDLAPGMERTILILYCPASNVLLDSQFNDTSDAIDLKGCRLTKQTFRVSFRCFQMQGTWQQAQSRVYDRTLGKSIHIRARTCTSIVTVTPSILHLGDCNIGELKGSSCMITNHSELPTVVKPVVTSKVISTVPNDEMTLGPKQSLELKVEIIPRKTNPNYSRLISIVNLRNKSNIPQICVRSSNMDAHHVIYHSLFYRLLTQSRSAFLNFEHVAVNSVGIQVFDLENITNALLHLHLQSSDGSRVKLYHLKLGYESAESVDASAQPRRPYFRSVTNDTDVKPVFVHSSLSSVALNTLAGSSKYAPLVGAGANTPTQVVHRQSGRVIRRRRSIGSLSELANSNLWSGTGWTGSKKSNMSTLLRSYLAKKPLANASSTSVASLASQASGSATSSAILSPMSNESSFATPTALAPQAPTTSSAMVKSGMRQVSEELTSLIELFDLSRAECEQYCHGNVVSYDKEVEIVGLVRERMRRFQAFIAEKKLIPLSKGKERNVRIPAKSQQRIVAVFSPIVETNLFDNGKIHMEKYKIFITLPPGGNRIGFGESTGSSHYASSSSFKNDQQGRAVWTSSRHPFDSRSSVRELLLKSRVCRSVLNVNQKNINFGRITTSSKSSKRLVVQNMSAIPLVYAVEKTGSISSGFLEIKEGEVGVVKAFGSKNICFEFQPTLAGPFEEKLKIVNVQDVENSVYVTIKAKVVKRETFKLLQSGQVISLGKCLVGERSEEVKISVRNTSRKRREYVIQVDPAFTQPNLRPAFYFAMDDTPSCTITQAQERKLDEELEKLEHKLRIAVTKKKTDKIRKLNLKIARVKSLLNGEQVPAETLDSSKPSGDLIMDYDESGNSESEFSETEATSSRSSSRSHHSKSNASSEGKGAGPFPTPNMFHFALDAEATCRIVTYVVFQTIHETSSASRELEGGPPLTPKSNYRSQKARKRQLRRESTPVNGVGKFLLYEQQNRDVVKELQYAAEIFFRTPAGETAYCRAVGRTLLPPFPQVTPPKKTLYRKFSMDRTGSGDRDSEERKKSIEASSSEPQLVIPRSASSGSLDHQVKGTTSHGNRKSARPEDRSRASHKSHPTEVTAVMPMLRRDNFQQEPIVMHLTHSKTLQLAPLVIRLEESPVDATLVKVVISYGVETDKTSVEVRWHPAKSVERLVTFTCQVVQRHSSLTDACYHSSGSSAAGASSTGMKGMLMKSSDAKGDLLPVTFQASTHSNVQLLFRWTYTQRAGFASSTSLASCIGSSTLDAIATHSEVNCGTLQFTCKPHGGAPNSEFIRNLDVVLARSNHRSLRLQNDRVDLGDQQLNTEVASEFLVENISSQSIRFLVMTSSSDASVGTGAIEGSPTNANGTGEFAFDHASGFVEPGSTTTVRFRYKGLTPGKHKERLLIRNLTDRLDCSTLSVIVRVTRPVYVRIPGLDPHCTGKLEVLDIGPCYVTPEMQDTSVESPNVSLKFSKVYKLTLQSQVSEPLVLSASSNLKTQCYVYEDGRLHREATNVVLEGHESIDLYAAFRPRLPSDAFKTGACRELVGGIRVQLFATNPLVDASQTEEGKANMVAEFTIKFVGIAGVSMARVTPTLLDFGVEANTTASQLPQSHEGRFEITNLSKGLPFQYRLFVTNDAEGYSDDDESLHVALRHEKGEIAPGETGQVEFRLMAYTNGLFRRRILIENIHYQGKINFVDVVLFVDNGALQCEVHPAAHETLVECPPSIDEEPAETSSDNQIGLGVVNVIKMSCSLPALVGANTDNEIIARKYRIFEDQSGEFSSAHDRYVAITNTSSSELLLRPLSTLPLIFAWNTQPKKCPFEGQEGTSLEPTTVRVEEARQLVFQKAPLKSDHAFPQAPTPLYYGRLRKIAPGGRLALHYRFASVCMTGPLPVEVIESGRLLPFEGLLAIQSFDPLQKNETEKEASTLKRLIVKGSFGESRIQVQEKYVSLGKVGSASGWKHSRFEITVKNSSEVAVSFAIANIPKCFSVARVEGAQRSMYHACLPKDTEKHVPTLRSLAIKADKHGKDSLDTAWHVWSLDAMTICVMELQFVQTEEVLIAGERLYDLRFLNLNNPQNFEVVQVQVQIISSYIEVVVDPESTGAGPSASAGATTSTLLAPHQTHVACLPQIVVPPPLDAPAQGCSFWFSLRNVYDEDLCIKFSSRLPASIVELMELVLFVRTSNAPVCELQIAPGESIDIRVVCRVFPSSRLSTEFWKASANVAAVAASLQDIGVVQLEFGIAGKNGTTRCEDMQVRGRLVPGKTFVLSTSALHFYATASELPTDSPIENLPMSLRNNRHLRRGNTQSTTSNSNNATVVYQLKNMVESFWLRNPCTTQALNFFIESIPMSFPGMCLVKGSTPSEMCAISDFFEAVAVPSSGTIAPGDSVKISVRLEEAAVGSLVEDKEGDGGPLSALHLQKLRHHPSWRSSSWGSDPPTIGKEANAPNLLYLTVHDTELSPDAGASTDVEIQLITQNPATLFPNEAKQSIDKVLLDAAFAAREKKLSVTTSKKLFPSPVEEEVNSDDPHTPPHQPEVNTKQLMVQPRSIQLPLLGIRGCTPVENTALECTRFLIDVGQHTIRNGGVVEWEITIEGIFSNSDCEQLEYRIHPVDGNVRSWLQLSRDRGTVDRSRNYQSVVLYFLRDVVGLYSTYVVLENLMNPGDLKVIHVRLEVIADLNSLRSMSSTLDPTASLFKVLVSSLNASKKHRQTSTESESKSGNLKSGPTSSSSATSNSSSSSLSSSSTLSHLEIDYGEVYYYKLYYNHSIVLENSSGLSLDFMLSSNARPQELSFSVAPTSYNEVTTITLGAHARTQVFLHLRPLPKTSASPEENERWDRIIEVYVNCRLVKDFRETVVLKVICNQPQLAVNVALSRSDKDLRMKELEASASSPSFSFGFANPPAFLGMVFSMSEAGITTASESKDLLCMETIGDGDLEKFLVVANTKSNENALIAIRNDTLFFEVQVDPGTSGGTETVPGSSVNATIPTEADYLDKSICAGKRPALLVTVRPQSSVVFRVIPNLKALQKNHQLWDHSVKEHMTVYNMKQFAEHYQITMCFTCTNLASFYVPPSISENYPLSTLEDLIAKFLQNYNTTWKLLLNCYNIDTFTPAAGRGGASASASSISVAKLAQMMSDMQSGLGACEKGIDACRTVLSSGNTNPDASRTSDSTFAASSTTSAAAAMADEMPPPIVAPIVLLPPSKTIHQLLQSFRALYFDFYYITDELVWYGVRGNAVRHSLTLADLAYGVVFANEIFRAYLAQVNPNVTMDGPLVHGATSTSASNDTNGSSLHPGGSNEMAPDSPELHPNGSTKLSTAGASTTGGGGSTTGGTGTVVPFPALLLPWIRQLRHFLSYFPENQEATLPLRQLYDMLKRLGC